MKKYLAIINFVIGLVLAVLSYYLPQPFWQSLGINLATTFLAVSVGIIVVNVYLDRDSRRGAVKSIFVLGNKAIARFHNKFLKEMWNTFGKSDFSNIATLYLDNKRDVQFIKPEDRKKLYDTAKTHRKDFDQLVNNMDSTLSELTNLVKWDLDAELLEFILDSRNSISKYREFDYDDTQDSINGIVENLLDIDILSQTARARLKKIGGISES